MPVSVPLKNRAMLIILGEDDTVIPLEGKGTAPPTMLHPEVTVKAYSKSYYGAYESSQSTVEGMTVYANQDVRAVIVPGRGHDAGGAIIHKSPMGSKLREYVKDILDSPNELGCGDTTIVPP